MSIPSPLTLEQTQKHTSNRVAIEHNPPVLILGGSVNALSVARSLGRRGIEVRASVSMGNHVLFSRYCKKRLAIPPGIHKKTYWKELLLGRPAEWIKGNVLFPCNDEAVEFIAEHYDRLRQHYIVETIDPDIHQAMLSKSRTMELAHQMGLAIPRFWHLNTMKDVEHILPHLSLPVIVKPVHSHLFLKYFKNKKYFFARTQEELKTSIQRCVEKGIQVIISEWIPGPDDLLASYYTYITEDGQPLFHYTKRVIRRFPVNSGLACLHVTDWVPEVADLGWRFFHGIGYRGLGNIEFKRDVRDGKWKVIEVNPRFTASQELITRSGLDIPYLIYNYLLGRPVQTNGKYKQKLYMWYPVRDFRAFLELRRRGEMTLIQWLKSVFHQPVLPYFRMDDPLPSLTGLWFALKN